MFQGKNTYGEFLDSEEKIATNILADRLSMLERSGLIVSKNDSERKTRFLYALTDKGIDLVPVMLEIVLWSARYDKKTGAPKDFVARIKNERQVFINEVMSNLRKLKKEF
jgi:DNA-binding HxlR family transcriptional regulator